MRPHPLSLRKNVLSVLLALVCLTVVDTIHSVLSGECTQYGQLLVILVGLLLFVVYWAGVVHTPKLPGVKCSKKRTVLNMIVSATGIVLVSVVVTHVLLTSEGEQNYQLLMLDALGPTIFLGVIASFIMSPLFVSLRVRGLDRSFWFTVGLTLVLPILIIVGYYLVVGIPDVICQF